MQSVAPEPYILSCVQAQVRVVTRAGERDAVIRENLNRGLSFIEFFSLHTTRGPKVVVFPELFLQGHDPRRNSADWAAIAMAADGPEVDALMAACSRFNLVIAGSIAERTAAGWSHTAVVWGPNGVVLRYTPGEALPVAETAFGRVACVLEEDLEAPELVRVLAMKGAEVMLYPAREVYGPRQVARQALRATRAYENSVYLAASNEGMGMRNGQRSFVARGRSSINDFTGRCLVEADGAGEALLSGTIDIGALRRARQERGSPVLAGSRMPSFLREMQAVMRGDG